MVCACACVRACVCVRTRARARVCDCRTRTSGAPLLPCGGRQHEGGLLQPAYLALLLAQVDRLRMANARAGAAPAAVLLLRANYQHAVVRRFEAAVLARLAPDQPHLRTDLDERERGRERERDRERERAGERAREYRTASGRNSAQAAHLQSRTHTHTHSQGEGEGEGEKEVTGAPSAVFLRVATLLG
jgi:hypothetical protein